MRELVLCDETLKQKSQYAINIGTLARLFVLNSADFRSHARLRETQVANNVPDAVACWPDCRFVVGVGAWPIIRSRGEARQIAGNLHIFTTRTNHESPFTT